MDIGPFGGVKATFARNKAAHFSISTEISKRALLLLLRFQKIIICEFAGVFVARERHKNPGFFYFQKGALCQMLG